MSVKSETKHYIRKRDATQITNADFPHILKDCQFFGDSSCIAGPTGLVFKALQDAFISEGHLFISIADTPSTDFSGLPLRQALVTTSVHCLHQRRS